MKAGSLKNLLSRSLTGILFVLLILGSLATGPVAFALLLLVFSLYALYEFFSSLRVFYASLSQPLRNTLLAAPLPVLLLLHFLNVLGPEWLTLLLLLPALCFAAEIPVKNARKVPLEECSLRFASCLLIGGPLPLTLAFYEPVGSLQENAFLPHFLMGYFLILWSNDTGAYLLGKSFGKHPLVQRISPGKTWEGTIGGVATATVVGGFWFNTGALLNSLPERCLFIFLVSFSAILGDLSISLIKRELGIKDFGHILPGHGGILDRVDAMIFSAPLVYIFMVIKGSLG